MKVVYVVTSNMSNVNIWQMTKNTPQTLKGFRDFMPRDALKRAWLKNKITETFEAWGYDPMETPTLEPLELFEGQIGEDEKLFYNFEDSGGRRVALRYDQTVPTARVIGNKHQELGLPFKRYQIASAFRAEKPQKGRYREFLQADADIFGVESATADAEVIALSLDIYRRLGFKNATALISDRSLLKDLPYDAIVALDKLEKIGEENVIKDMIKKGIDNSAAKKYLDLIKNLKPNETINIIFNYLKSCGFDETWYKFDPTIARSFSYSDGPIWEIKIPEYNAGSVLGGERYDNLIENITGKAIPATGFAVGFDRTLEAAQSLGLIPDIPTQTKALVTIFEPNLLDKSLDTAAGLRTAGINTEIYPDAGTKLDKQLKYADKKGIPYAIIIGPQEAQNGVVQLKDLVAKTQSAVTLEEAINELKTH
jgi:histidyl-tRNA synthetase